MKKANDDETIIQRFWDRDEEVLAEVATLYGSYLFVVAFNVLNNAADSEECVNDTYLSAWEKIPPYRPHVLLTFLAKITRGLAIDKWRERKSLKRGGDQYVQPFEELEEVIMGFENLEAKVETKELAAIISRLLARERPIARQAFICRYFYCDKIQDIAGLLGRGEGTIKTILRRTRIKLRQELIKEGWFDES
ncbi:MAG TPA: RNA polymerase sigma factor [Clostridiaceae bacterium]|nr:RNA polymerase sigma factor [Clostridiaceae bacterium]